LPRSQDQDAEGVATPVQQFQAAGDARLAADLIASQAVEVPDEGTDGCAQATCHSEWPDPSHPHLIHSGPDLLVESYALETMGPFEYGFFTESRNLTNKHRRVSPPVELEIACTTQAVRDELMAIGLSSETTAAVLLQIAGRIHDLEPQLNEQIRMRRVERQMRRALRKR